MENTPPSAERYYVLILSHALAIGTVARIDTDDLTLVDEERHANFCAGLYGSGFEGIGSGIALQTRLGISNGELYFGRQFGEEDGIGRSIRNDIYIESLFEEIDAGDEVVRDRHLLEGLVIHEDIILTFLIEELVRATLHAYILEFLTDIESALEHAAIHYIFEFNTHDGVTFSRLHMQELNYEIQTAVHADAYAVFNVLAVNHKIYFWKIRAKVVKNLHICKKNSNFVR